MKSCDLRQQGGPQEEDNHVDNKQQDDYVLRKLFKKTGAVKGKKMATFLYQRHERSKAHSVREVFVTGTVRTAM